MLFIHLGPEQLEVKVVGSSPVPVNLYTLQLALSAVVGVENKVKETISTETIIALLLLLWWFTSTETSRLIRDGEPGMSSSTFTQPLSSETNVK